MRVLPILGLGVRKREGNFRVVDFRAQGTSSLTERKPLLLMSCENLGGQRALSLGS